MVDPFFNERGDQSEFKARIVRDYFFAWANVVKGAATRFHGGRIAYIDLFAGPGRYKDGAKSTPLLVLEQVARDEQLSQMVVSIFNDEDPDHSQNLRQEIGKIEGIDRLKFAPVVENGDAGGYLGRWMQETSLIPTFSFIDPFGYKGLSLGLIKGAIKDWGCDCVFFFNYNRINAGLPNQHVGHHMDALFGAERADSLRKSLENKTPIQREAMILEEISQAIKLLGGKFVLPFRFKNSQGTRSSHHLVFVSKHPRGYKIMKEIMARQSSRSEDGVASFEYSPADENSPFLLSLLRPVDDLAQELRKVFSGRTMGFSQLYDEHNVNTPFVEKNYREALTRLEKAGQISVLSGSQFKRKGYTFGPSVLISFP